MLFHIAEKIIQTFDKQIEIVVNFVVGIVKDHNMLASLGSGIKWFFIIYIGIILISILYDNLEMAVMTNRTLEEHLDIWRHVSKKGDPYESGAATFSKRLFKGKQYNNVILNCNFKCKNFGNELDKVIVTPKGIFVVECKSRSRKTWMGDIFDHDLILCSLQGNKEYVQNPLVQNTTHVNALFVLANKINALNASHIYNVVMVDEPMHLTADGESMDNIYFSVEKRTIFLTTHSIDAMADVENKFKKIYQELPDVLDKKQLKAWDKFLRLHILTKKEIQFRKWELEKKDLANHVYEWEYFNDSDNPSSFINLARRKAAEQNIELYKLKK